MEPEKANSSQAYRKTPLDFAEDSPLVVPVYYPILWRLGIGKDRCTKTVDRVSNDRITPLKSDREHWSRWMHWGILIEQVLRLSVVAYGAVHLVA